MLTRERQRLRIAELPVDHHWIFYRREPWRVFCVPCP